MDVRDQILAEAARKFAARGFDGTTLAEIAEAVGIRKGSLLYHFPSKDALRRSVLETMLSHWNDVLPRLLMAATSGQDQFDAVVSELISFFAADPDRARLIIREVMDRPGELEGLIQSHVRPWVDIVCNYIRKGKDRGEIHADVDPEAYVIQVINTVVAGVATYQSIGALLPARAGQDGVERYRAELLRVARRSLFSNQATAATPAPRRADRAKG
jgi:TetR/AcrR family transcriptional regulator